MVRLKVPRLDATFRVEVAEVVVDDKTTLVGESVGTPRPGGVVAVRLTVPEKPWDPSIVIVDIPVAPELTVNDVGLGVTLKLGGGTVIDADVECEVVELLAVIDTLYGPGTTLLGT
jgi:hypothetical protein